MVELTGGIQRNAENTISGWHPGIDQFAAHVFPLLNEFKRQPVINGSPQRLLALKLPMFVDTSST
jgi:hypothetical protein